MNSKSQLQFIYRCFVLLESGITLPETLQIILKLEKKKRGKIVLQKMCDEIQRGGQLSRSIESNIKNFDSTLLSMITFGESSGILPQILRQAYVIREKGSEVKRKLISALIYPTFIAFATVAMTLFLVMYIFPKIIPLFLSMNIKLPLITQFILGLYTFLLHNGLLSALLATVLIICFFIFYRLNLKFKTFIQSRLLGIPVLGLILQKYSLGMSCRSIGTLLDCGQSLPQIVIQIKKAASLEIYKNVWSVVQIEITRGSSISLSLQPLKKYIPEIVPDLLSIGEKTGSLSSMFQHISKMFEEDLEEVIKHLSTILEPLLMVLMGLIVGSVALSIILPIYEITNHLNH